MSAEHLTAFAKVIWAAAGLFGLVAVVQLMLHPVLVEIFRQRMFNLRREFFLYMIDGHVSPSEHAYRLLLETMNAMIRYAQIFSLSRVILAWPFVRREPQWKALVDRCIEAIQD